MTSGEPIVDRLLVGQAIVNPLGLSPRQYVARKARDCRRRARELRLQLQRQVVCTLFLKIKVLTANFEKKIVVRREVISVNNLVL